MHGPLVDQTLLVAQSVDETAVAVSLAGIPASYITHSVKWGAGTTAGVVVIEAADAADYTGTWSPLATITWAAASTTETVVLAGAYKAIRHRISTAVANGTVTTHLLAS
jgi:hypothetical protein